MNRLIALIMAIAATAGMWAQKNSAPDFAYPRQVEKNADAAIGKA